MSTTTTDRELPLVVHVKPLCALLDVSPATVRRWVRAGQFPKPIKLGGRRVAWSRAAILGWLHTQQGRIR